MNFNFLVWRLIYLKFLDLLSLIDCILTPSKVLMERWRKGGLSNADILEEHLKNHSLLHYFAKHSSQPFFLHISIQEHWHTICIWLHTWIPYIQALALPTPRQQYRFPGEDGRVSALHLVISICYVCL